MADHRPIGKAPAPMFWESRTKEERAEAMKKAQEMRADLKKKGEKLEEQPRREAKLGGRLGERRKEKERGRAC